MLIIIRQAFFRKNIGYKLAGAMYLETKTELRIGL
jgi:hypothetical protein